MAYFVFHYSVSWRLTLVFGYQCAARDAVINYSYEFKTREIMLQHPIACSSSLINTSYDNSCKIPYVKKGALVHLKLGIEWKNLPENWDRKSGSSCFRIWWKITFFSLLRNPLLDFFWFCKHLESNTGHLLVKTACPKKIWFSSNGPKTRKSRILVPLFKCEY